MWCVIRSLHKLVIPSEGRRGELKLTEVDL